MKKKQLLSLTVIITLIVISSLTACNNNNEVSTLSTPSVTNIYGTITTEANTPIKGVAVSLDDKYTTTTNKQGTYAFEQIPTGDYNWEVEADGYQSIAQKITLTANQDKIIDKSLLPIQIAGQVTIYNTTKSRASALQLTQISVQSNVIQSDETTASLKQASVLPKHKDSEIIIKYNSTTSKQSIAKLVKKNKLTKTKKVKLKRGQAVKYKLPKGKKVKKMVNYYRRLPEVEWAIPNYLAHLSAIPNDNLYYSNLNYSWGHINTNLEAAWDLQKGSNEVTVAVIDSGIIPGHPDLTGNLLFGADFVGDANPELSFDMTDIDPTDETTQANGGSHGTHVAGIIGAVTNNSEGVAGANWQVNLLPIRVIDSDSTGTMLDLVEGINYAIEQRVDILNLSLGFPSTISEDAKDFLKSYINQALEAGITVVAAVGNETASVLYPAAFDNVIGVGAVNYNNEKTWYSNYGSEVDLVAPGGESNLLIGSTWGYYQGNKTYSGYAEMQGTSMATPYISGITALLVADGTQMPQQIRKCLIDTAIDLGISGKDDYYGYGLVDAYGALLGEKLTNPVVFAAVKDGEQLYVKSEVKDVNDDGSYQLAQIEGKEVYIVGWRDVNENQLIDAGDYYGITDQAISITENSLSAIDFNMYYIDEASKINDVQVIK